MVLTLFMHAECRLILGHNDLDPLFRVKDGVTWLESQVVICTH